MNDPEAIVVGAGPAGMVLALLLSRCGIRVAVLEQASTFAREFRGELLQPGATRIFSDLKLDARIRALGSEFPAGVDLQFGRRSISFDLPSVFASRQGDGIVVVPQQQLLETLAAEAARSDGFALTMGCCVRELLHDSRGVVGVRAQTAGGERIDLRAPIVIACDGRFSAVRRAAGIALHEKPVPFDLLWFSTPLPAGLANRVYVRVLKNQLLVSFASRSNRMQVGWFVHKGAYARFRAQPFAGALDHIAEHVPVQLSAAVRESLGGWHDISLLPIVSQMSERWSKRGLLLLGDAAHPMSPAGGQGINVAIYDAVVAARRLAPALAARSSLEDVTRAIEDERRPAVAAIQRVQNRFTVLLYTLGPAAALRLASAVIRLGGRVPWRPRSLTRGADRLLWGYPEVRADSGPWHVP